MSAALRNSLARLATDPDFGSVVGHLLSSLAEQLGAADAVMWRYDVATGRHQLALVVDRARPGRPGASETASRWVEAFVPLPGQDGREIGDAVIQINSAAEIDDAPSFATWRTQLRERGVRSMARVPLVLGDEYLGSVALGFAEDRRFDPEEVELAFALAAQLVLAVDMTRRATQERKESDSSHGHTVTAEHGPQGLAKANDALQETVDALGTLHDIDQFLPAALRVAAAAFGAEDGAFWEHFAGEPVRLRYWLRGGRVLRPEELLELEAEWAAALARRLAEGFHLPDPYLGTPVRERTRSVVVDHRRGTGLPELDAFHRDNGWDIELNVPLLVGGLANGALLIFRGPGATFTASEVALAEALGKQIALAMQVSRIASRTRVATVARERLAVVNRANDTLRRTADKLAEVPALEAFLGQVLQSLVETFSGSGGSFWRGDQYTGILALDLSDGVVTHVESGLHPNGIGLRALLLGSSDVARRLQVGVIVVLDVESARWSPSSQEWLRKLGVRTLLIVPLMLGGRHFGCLTVRLPDARTPGDEEIELARALATQAALAMELTRLAEEAKDKATAEARAAELVKANEALRTTLDVLATNAEMDAVLGHTLRAISEQLVGPGGTATLWLADDDAHSQRLHLELEAGTVGPAVRSRWGAAGSVIPFKADPLFDRHYGQGMSSVLPVEKLESRQAAHLRRLGVQAIVTLPMSLRSRPVGSFIVYLFEGMAEPTCERMELAQALAHQATLALQLTRLAEQAKQAAVASERESAALVRAAELTEANAALKRSLDVLASEADVDRFLGGLLSEIGKRVGAARIVLWLEGDEGRRAESRLSWDQAAGVGKGPDKLVGAQASRALLSAVHSLRHQRLALLQPVRASAVFNEEETVALQDAGIEAILHLPLVLGDRFLGAVAVLFSVPKTLPSDELELVQAFAHQATLALRLAQLSIEAQSAAILQERARLAREIHDGIAQSFIGISMQLHRATGPGGSGASTRALELAEHGLAEARRAVKALGPLHLVGKTFVDAVADMARAAVGEKVKIKVTSSGVWTGLSPDIEGHLFRIVQEAVNNMVKHAEAGELSIELSSSATELSVLVSDNGKGFDTKAHDPDQGFGLFSMRQRAESIGASLMVVSAPGAGTQVFVSLKPTEE